ncbi:hypothetical protein BaRGS_00007713, partial [Batillaria attramentaria]
TFVLHSDDVHHMGTADKRRKSVRSAWRGWAGAASDTMCAGDLSDSTGFDSDSLSQEVQSFRPTGNGSERSRTSTENDYASVIWESVGSTAGFSVGLNIGSTEPRYRQSQKIASLMDQDLSLMKQLLTLNEEIEQLKWRRRYCWSRSSVLTSSGDVDLGSAADFTSSETSIGWWAESGDLPAKYPSPSTLSLQMDHGRLSVYDEEDPTGTFNRRSARSKGILKAAMAAASSCHTTPQKTAGDPKGDFKERESFDSGIHEGYSDTLMRTNSVTEVTHL